jgi:hypothetical protein
MARDEPIKVRDVPDQQPFLRRIVGLNDDLRLSIAPITCPTLQLWSDVGVHGKGRVGHFQVCNDHEIGLNEIGTSISSNKLKVTIDFLLLRSLIPPQCLS